MDNSSSRNKSKKIREKLTKGQRRREWFAAGCVVLAFALFLGGAVLAQTVLIPGSHYNKGLKLKNAGSFSEAVSEFTEANGYKDSKAQITECNKLKEDHDYQEAIALYKSGAYDAAMTAFDKLRGVGSSNQYYKLCQYNRGLTYLEAKEYDKAKADFDAVSGMLDSVEKSKECIYQKALIALNEENYTDAAELFDSVSDYLDSATLRDSAMVVIHMDVIRKASVGDVVVFGSYEQDNNTENGPEDVEWIVLAKTDTQVLLMSKYLLDCVKMHTTRPYKKIEWSATELRNWCNTTFYETVFDASEQAYIAESKVDLTTNTSSKLKCQATTDKVFLLSLEEVKKYLPTEESRVAEPTAYAVANGLYKFYGSDSSFWWLRTRGASNATYSYYSYVNESGFIDFQRGIVYDYQDAGLRACVWVEINQ